MYTEILFIYKHYPSLFKAAGVITAILPISTFAHGDIQVALDSLRAGEIKRTDESIGLST